MTQPVDLDKNLTGSSHPATHDSLSVTVAKNFRLVLLLIWGMFLTGIAAFGGENAGEVVSTAVVLTIGYLFFFGTGD